MTNRGKLRRKMVLPVVVHRGNGQEKQLAHTLDVTEISARLGGLRMLLDLGEVIEIQRGGRKAKFEVYWMGTPGTELEGQAGVRGVDPAKSIWSVHLPQDEPDLTVDAIYLRREDVRLPASAVPEQIETTRYAWSAATLRTPVSVPEQIAAMRYECNAGATLRAPGSNYPFRVQVKSIHLGGIEVESITTLPLNTVVNIEMRIEGTTVETAGRVTASTHRVGMEISFHKMPPEKQRKIVQVLQKLRQKAWDEQQVPALPSSPPKAAPAPLSMDPIRELLALCRMLRADLDHWKCTRTAAEIEELRKALAELQEMLAPNITIEMHEYLASFVPESSGPT